MVGNRPRASTFRLAAGKLRGVLSIRSDRRSRTGRGNWFRQSLADGRLCYGRARVLAHGVSRRHGGISPLTELPGAMLTDPTRAIREGLLAMELEICRKRLREFGSDFRLPLRRTPPRKKISPKFRNTIHQEIKHWEERATGRSGKAEGRICAPSEQLAEDDGPRRHVSAVGSFW